ncbi:MAG TPA: baseplate J/gp47 family protein, partial [Candidatus Paceibacterota bacterium]|nr:baseplate J/gp47 family protein [Candidatus Paceibacterota bacterium]
MASTKIINVLKDDSFTEILDLFRATPAEEVIIVLPKRSKAFNKESHFETLKDTSKELDKTVSFLCSNQEVNDLAKDYGFDVLLPRSSTPTKKTSSKVSMVNEIENFYDNPPKAIAEEASISEMDQDDEPEAEEIEEGYEDTEEEELPAEVQRMDEIVRPVKDEQRPVKISTHRERTSSVDVHRDFMAESLEQRAIHEIHHGHRHDDEPSEIEAESQDHNWTNWLQHTSATKATARPAPTKSPRRGRGNGPKRMLIGFAGAAIVLLGFAVYISTGNAKVTITPKSQQLDFQLNMTASANASSVDAANFTIPGQLFNIQKTASQSFQATGKQATAQKAHGAITVTNKTSANQPLIATTRFQSADGHIFRTLTNVVVPAGKTAVVQVAAVSSGADYNVPAGKFTIPAFKEQNNAQKYADIYGMTTDSMHGGTSGEATVVSQQDFDGAKAALTDSAKQAAQDALKSQMDGLTVIAQPQADATTANSTAQVGDAADSFTMTMTGSIQTIGFKPDDLAAVINAYVTSKNNLDTVFDKLDLAYSNIQYDAANQAMHFTVEVKGPGYAKIDTDQLVANLEGKNDNQIKSYLQGIPGVGSANVYLFP